MSTLSVYTLSGRLMRVNVREARRRLAAMLDVAAAGDEVVIERHGESFQLRRYDAEAPRRLPRADWLREGIERDSLTASERLADDRER